MEPSEQRDARALAEPAAGEMTGVATQTPVEREAQPARSEWKSVVARYQRSSVGHAIWQLVTTLVPLAAAFYLMYQSLALPYVVTLLLAVPTAGFLVRTFIVMHDCAHGSFLPWRRVNDAIGFITGVLTFTPFVQWRRDHAIHHASSGDLDRRGHGDVTTLTVHEYLSRSTWGRLKYRLYRHPFVLFGLGPIDLLIGQRLTSRAKHAKDRQTASIWWTNIAIAAAVIGFSLWIGFKAVLLVYFPVMYIAAAAGIWLFYVQHQFEDTYWRDHGEWDYATSAIRGSSYFKLPAILRWFTGSIGLHHVHHLGPRIPNYNLKKCHDENVLFHDVTVLTMAASVRTLRLTLWDEDRQRLIGFRELSRSQRRGFTTEGTEKTQRTA
jgi:omega-6 fatty acid desaturase (delta-12 desaturase)